MKALARPRAGARSRADARGARCTPRRRRRRGWGEDSARPVRAGSWSGGGARGPGRGSDRGGRAREARRV